MEVFGYNVGMPTMPSITMPEVVSSALSSVKSSSSAVATAVSEKAASGFQAASGTVSSLCKTVTSHVEPTYTAIKGHVSNAYGKVSPYLPTARTAAVVLGAATLIGAGAFAAYKMISRNQQEASQATSNHQSLIEKYALAPLDRADVQLNGMVNYVKSTAQFACGVAISAVRVVEFALLMIANIGRFVTKAGREAIVDYAKKTVVSTAALGTCLLGTVSPHAGQSLAHRLFRSL